MSETDVAQWAVIAFLSLWNALTAGRVEKHHHALRALYRTGLMPPVVGSDGEEWRLIRGREGNHPHEPGG